MKRPRRDTTRTLTCNACQRATGVEQRLANPLHNGQYALVPGPADEATAANILLKRWDPLCVADIDVAPDGEYLHEAARVMSLLSTGIDRPRLVAHLTNERRGLSRVADLARDQAAADALLDWWATVRDA